jgi:type II secretory pathway pseudopilin PulG
MNRPRRPSRRRRAAAYSLVEVLAALLLAAIVLPVAMRGITLATRITSVGADEIEATMLAELKMNELLASGSYATGDDSGDFSDYTEDETEYARYEWKSHAEDWDDDGAMQQLDVTVTWERTGGQRRVTLSTLVPTRED